MTISYTFLAELDHQRRAQVATSIATSRRTSRQRRARWWELDHLRHPMRQPVTVASRVAATA